MYVDGEAVMYVERALPTLRPEGLLPRISPGIPIGVARDQGYRG